jgi:hypothetical protein
LFFLNVDFVNRVALVAVAKERSRSVIVDGGGSTTGKPADAERVSERRAGFPD